MRSWNNDERVKRSNGLISRPRVIVLEGLEAQGGEGATLDDLVMLIGSDMNGENPKPGISKTLHGMLEDEYVVCIKDRWYLKEHAPVVQSNGAHPAPLPTNGQRVQVAAQVQKRSAKRVSLYQTPRVWEDAIAVSLLIGERWFEIPVFGPIRICRGGTIPDWSAEKRPYTDVTVIKITRKGGLVDEEHTSPKEYITIDAEE